MYKYAGTENQKTGHNKLPIELFTTAELVEELRQREAVDSFTLAPYEEKEIKIDGAAVVLIVTD